MLIITIKIARVAMHLLLFHVVQVEYVNQVNYDDEQVGASCTGKLCMSLFASS